MWGLGGGGCGLGGGAFIVVCVCGRGESVHTSVCHGSIGEFSCGGLVSCGERVHTPIRHDNIRDLDRDEFCRHPADWLAARLAHISLLHPIPLRRQTHRRLVLKEGLVRLASLDEALRPRYARLDLEEGLKLAKLLRKDTRGFPRPIDLGRVAFLFVELGDKPVEVRFCVV